MSRREFILRILPMLEMIVVIFFLILSLFCLSILLKIEKKERSEILSKLEEPSRQYVIVIEEQQIPVAEYNDSYYVREHGKTNMDDSYCINKTNGILEHIANGKKEYFTEWSIRASSDKETP